MCLLLLESTPIVRNFYFLIPPIKVHIIGSMVVRVILDKGFDGKYFSWKMIVHGNYFVSFFLLGIVCLLVFQCTTLTINVFNYR